MEQELEIRESSLDMRQTKHRNISLLQFPSHTDLQDSLQKLERMEHFLIWDQMENHR